MYSIDFDFDIGFRYLIEPLPHPDYKASWLLGSNAACDFGIKREFHSGFQ